MATTKKPRSKYRIWDRNVLVPAFTRQPRDPRAVRLEKRTFEEAHLGLRWYIPAEVR